MERMRYDGPDAGEPDDMSELLRARMRAAEGRLTGLGEMQEVTPHRQEQARTRLEADAEYAIKAQTHVWIVIVTHKASEQVLDQHDGLTVDSLPILDMDTMYAPPYVGCYVCETPYEPRLRLRKCPGEPS